MISEKSVGPSGDQGNVTGVSDTPSTTNSLTSSHLDEANFLDSLPMDELVGEGDDDDIGPG